ncbi:MAG: methionyl-tRNA formyltransferase [Culicoidibacterales bacterium]
MPKKKIIFMGTPNFAAHILKQLLEEKQDLYEIIAVISQPDKPIGRKRVLTPTEVKQVALSYNLPILQPAKIATAYEEIKALEPDLLITAAYGQLVPVKILELPKFRCINVHGSLLPKYRGGAPIHYAIIKGESKTGITIMYMEKALDAGHMIASVEIPILDDDNLATMYEKLQKIGGKLLLEILPDFFAYKIIAIPQDLAKVTYAPNITKEQTKINWHGSAVEVFNHVRGLYPAPATFTIIDEVTIKIYEVSIKTMDVSSFKPGQIIHADKSSCYIATSSNAISLKSIQLSGKKRQKIQEVINGIGKTLLVEGACFE